MESPRPRAGTVEPRLREITPACAGKSRRAPQGRYPHRKNHPRMRGEERGAATTNCCLSEESPPHARGRVLPSLSLYRSNGITPACAGKRVWALVLAGAITESPPHARGRAARTRRARAPGWNHPRMRGEEGNENAASEGMSTPPKCKFSALFQEPPPSAARFQNAGPGAFRLSSIMPHCTLCVAARIRPGSDRPCRGHSLSPAPAPASAGREPRRGQTHGRRPRHGRHAARPCGRAGRTANRRSR